MPTIQVIRLQLATVFAKKPGLTRYHTGTTFPCHMHQEYSASKQRIDFIVLLFLFNPALIGWITGTQPSRSTFSHDLPQIHILAKKHPISSKLAKGICSRSIPGRNIKERKSLTLPSKTPFWDTFRAYERTPQQEVPLDREIPTLGTRTVKLHPFSIHMISFQFTEHHFCY